MVGIFEGGRAIYTYNALSNADSRKHSGKRSSTRTSSPSRPRQTASWEALPADTDMVIDGIDCGTPAETPCVYRVEMTYEFEPVLIGAFFSPTLAAEGEMPVEAIQP